jgi:hypothetical protein
MLVEIAIFFEPSGRNCDLKEKIIENWGICRRVSQHTKKTRGTRKKVAAFMWDYETCGGFKHKKRKQD